MRSSRNATVAADDRGRPVILPRNQLAPLAGPFASSVETAKSSPTKTTVTWRANAIPGLCGSRHCAFIRRCFPATQLERKTKQQTAEKKAEDADGPHHADNSHGRHRSDNRAE